MECVWPLLLSVAVSTCTRLVVGQLCLLMMSNGCQWGYDVQICCRRVGRCCKPVCAGNSTGRVQPDVVLAVCLAGGHVVACADADAKGSGSWPGAWWWMRACVIAQAQVALLLLQAVAVFARAPAVYWLVD